MTLSRPMRTRRASAVASNMAIYLAESVIETRTRGRALVSRLALTERTPDLRNATGRRRPPDARARRRRRDHSRRLRRPGAGGFWCVRRGAVGRSGGEIVYRAVRPIHGPDQE